MNGEELKQALINRHPVIYTQINGEKLEYAYVSGIIYRMRNGKVDVSAELMDKNRNSVTVANPIRIKLKSMETN